jgi:hypothetical protein
VLEVSDVESNQQRASCTQVNGGLADQPIATHKPTQVKMAARIDFYCDRGEGVIRLVDRHMAVSSRRWHQYC